MKKINYYLLTGILLVLVTHAVWFFSLGVLSWGDWGFLFKKGFELLIYPPYAWDFTGIGSLNIKASFYPTDLLFNLISNFSFALAERIVFLWPAVLTAYFGCYLLIKYITKSDLAALLGSLVYQFNIYFLMLQTQHINILVANALVPLFLYLVMKTYELRDTRLAILAGLTGFAMSAYDFRIFYIIAFVSFMYFLFRYLFDKQKIVNVFKATKQFILIFTIILFLSSYWLITFILAGQISENSVFSRGLFGGSFLTLQNAIALYHSFWSIDGVSWFRISAPPLIMWVLPLLAFLGLVLNRKNKVIVFFGVLACVGIFLSKQEAEPFHSAYYWLFSNLPGFNSFREASKFYMLIALSYAVLVGSLFIKIKAKTIFKTKVYKIIAATFVIIVLAVNFYPFVFGNPKTLFIGRNMPKDYEKVASVITSENNEAYRVMWLPTQSRWSYYNESHPSVSVTEIMSKLNNTDSNDLPVHLAIESFMHQANTKEIMRVSGIKYLIVPMRDDENEDDFFNYYGYDRNFYISALSKVPWLNRIDIGTNEIAVFKNSNYDPHITVKNKLFNIKSSKNIEDIISFKRQNDKSSKFDYTINDESTNISAIGLQDVFGTLASSNIKDNAIKNEVSLPTGVQTSLYSNTSKPELSYQISNNQLIFHKSLIYRLKANNAPIAEPEHTNDFIYSQNLELNKNYYISIDSKLLKIDRDDLNNRYLGYNSKSVDLYSTTINNLVPNNSLENGFWKKEVEDCNNFDNKKDLYMNISDEEHSDQNYSLEMQANNHTACTGPEVIKVNSQSKYLLDFNYKIKDGVRAGFELKLIW